jgi:tetratricopeptide (TPR) repeat protein
VNHISEEDLALHSYDRDAFSATRSAEIEHHLASCSECQVTHDYFVLTEEELREGSTWEPIVGSPTYLSLMSYGARVAEEDQEAEVILRPYIDHPATAAWNALTAKRRFLTGGVVRTLCKAAHHTCENFPLAALTLADAAIGIAEAIPKSTYPAHAVDQLRATAWKERANAQMLLGSFPQAHISLDNAERFYRKLRNSGLGLSIVALVRAGLLYEQGRSDEAIAKAEHAERGFMHAGDEKRRMDALFLRGGLLYENGNAAEAALLFRQIVDYGENIADAHLMARGSYAIGDCEVARGNLSEASVHYHRALMVFREAGPDRDRISTQWGIARVVLRSGRLGDAISRLREVEAEYESRGMVTDAALVGLDIAEGLLALDRAPEIVVLAQHLFGIFTQAGMLTGALSALAYLKEAAAARRLTTDDVSAIRTFIRRAERQPSLRFVPPPARPR